ncbi:MAG TPA: hypothetical protein RMH99_12120 [Sandaracinaceae bacterium LLY-WYZ-13_1]|nr:hypothetical protein [Sandaracinaceae bacterium LLY-WYZ-13_1]
MAAIELAPGAGDNGLAVMMATMMSQNLEDHPERLPTFGRLVGRVAIVAEDADVALTMELLGGRAVVHDGIVGIPDVTVRGSAELIADLSRMETGPLGLPDPRGEVNRQMVAALRERRLRVFGMPVGLPLLARLGAVLAID